MTALALQRSDLKSAADREGMILAYLTNAYQITLAAATAIDRYEVVRDLAALKSLAKNYNLSEEASRALAETSIRCVRLFGSALRKALPGESRENMKRRAEATGATMSTCQYASALATYSEADLTVAFEELRRLEMPAGVRYVYEALRGKNPRLAELRANRSVEVTVASGSQHAESALKVCLSLALRIMEAKEYTFDDARREYGLTLRRYRRHLARLRDAGMVLDSPMGSKQPMGYVRFIAIDPTLSAVRVA